MDLNTLKPSERTIEIKHPGTGLPLGLRITLCSMDDDRLSDMKRAILDRRLYLEQRNKAFKAPEVEENSNNLLFAAARGWEWYNPTGSEGDAGYDPEAMPAIDGEQPGFNQRNFKRMLALPWFVTQLNEELEERKSFFDNSKMS